jgi:outer membrane lipoprotein-sorting protein
MSFKGFLLSVITTLLPLLASAQSFSLLDKFYKGVSESCLEMTYSYSTRLSGIDNNGKGDLSLQGLMWKAKGNGVEMYSDSKSVWIVDPEMKEVVIEPAADEESSQWVSNPAVIFSRLYDIFVVNESFPSHDGMSVKYVLKPKSKSDIDYCNIELFKSDAMVRRAAIALSDGTLIKIEVSSMKLTPKVSDEAFLPQTKFDSTWIVTDLR